MVAAVALRSVRPSQKVGPDGATGDGWGERGEVMEVFYCRPRARGRLPRRPHRWLGSRDASLVYVRSGYCVVLSYLAGLGLSPWGWVDENDPICSNLMHYYYTGEQDMKRRVTTADSPEAPSHFADVESVVFGKLHPIVAHLAVSRYDDGTPRQPGTLMIRCVGASWQVTAKEPDVAAQLVITAPTLDDALAALSLALESDQTPWQPDPWATGRTRGKKR